LEVGGAVSFVVLEMKPCTYQASILPLSYSLSLFILFLKQGLVKLFRLTSNLASVYQVVRITDMLG
jgi:hypothetical protein